MQRCDQERSFSGYYAAPWSLAEPPSTRLPGVRKQLLRAAQGRVPGPRLRLSTLHGAAAQVAPLRLRARALRLYARALRPYARAGARPSHISS